MNVIQRPVFVWAHPSGGRQPQEHPCPGCAHTKAGLLFHLKVSMKPSRILMRALLLLSDLGIFLVTFADKAADIAVKLACYGL